MAKVHVVNVSVLENPSTFLSKFQFEITFECVEDLQEDLEWKIIYVGSAESEEHDQVLDTVYVGPVPEGRHLFVFEADPPDASKIPQSELVGVTVVLVTCSYKGQEFVRVGYYVNNAYSDPEMQENPPEVPKLDAVTRNILASQPRVTKFKIDWDDAKDTENIPPANENTSTDNASLNTTATTAGSSTSAMDAIKASLLESSNSASAMEVA
ncbi:hypothetical protein HAZT_HAZT010295 [Hyalella azteca]|uniref:Histone chaperone asf1-like n=1 Tax=Hyalella azteca TaxID=294128 RepID=A0A6A0GTK1_HYAAZ|nr:histone chaperone asf1-like [Hyalella azteca]KAA0188017.1 hypothetical protein HAZT_HAZT010295 [Hyalella azteca]